MACDGTYPDITTLPDDMLLSAITLGLMIVEKANDPKVQDRLENALVEACRRDLITIDARKIRWVQ